MSIGEEPESDNLRRSEEKLLMDEQLADLRQQVAERDQEIGELRRRLDRTSADYQQSRQTLTDTKLQVSLYCVTVSTYHGPQDAFLLYLKCPILTHKKLSYRRGPRDASCQLKSDFLGYRVVLFV